MLQWLQSQVLIQGSEHSCGITVDGDLRCWGRQDYFYGLSDSGRPAAIIGFMQRP